MHTCVGSCQSLALCNRKNKALDRDVMDEVSVYCYRSMHYLYLLGFVQQKYPAEPKTRLVDVVNDKCAQCRRKLHD